MNPSYVDPADAAWLSTIRAGSGPDPDPDPVNTDGGPPADPADPGDPAAPDPDIGADFPTDPDLFGQQVINLDLHPDPDLDDDEEHSPRRFNRVVAAGFAAAAIVATLVTVIGISIAVQDDPAPPPPPPPQRLSPVAAPAPPPPPPAAVDAPLRFTATSDCDTLPGSTSAQLLADPQSAVPWICASQVPGQVLKIYLDKPYIITAVVIVPGAVNKTNPNDDGDSWLRHRVVTRLQWQFNDRANTIKSQHTGNVHGQAVQKVPATLASEITVIIQETSRPPATAAAPTPAPTPAPSDGMLGPILGTPPGPPPAAPLPLGPDDERPDPSDGTFAISSILIMGHEVI